MAAEQAGYDISEFQTIQIPASSLPESVDDDLAFGRQLNSILVAHGIEAEGDIVLAVHNLRTSLVKKTVRLKSSDIYCFVFANRRIYMVDFLSPNYTRWVSKVASGFFDRFPEAEMTGLEILSGLRQSGQGQLTKEDLQLLKSDPATWLQNYFPHTWTAADDKPARQRFLKDAAKNISDEVDVQDEDVVAAWQQLASQRNLKPKDSASENSFAMFADLTGFEVPAELKALLRESNGSEGAFGFRDLMSIEQITQEWQTWKDIFDGTSVHDLTSHYDAADDRTLSIYTTPFWVPFVEERTGNFIAIDLLPGPAGKRGQIIYFGAEESHNLRVLADNLVDFLLKETDNTSEDDDMWF